MPGPALPPTSSHCSELPQGAVADLDGDGDGGPVLAMPLFDQGLLALRRTTGPDTFGPEQLLPVGQGPRASPRAT